MMMNKKILIIILAVLFLLFLASFSSQEKFELEDVYNDLECEMCDFSLRGTGEHNIVDDIDKIIKNRIELGNNKDEITNYLINTYPKLFKKKKTGFLKFYLLGFVFALLGIFIFFSMRYFKKADK
jgi:cytochrome c-type biogenesis protein CcmH/NrfF